MPYLRGTRLPLIMGAGGAAAETRLLYDTLCAPGIANADALDGSRLQDRMPETSVAGAKYVEVSGTWTLTQNQCKADADARLVTYETGISDGTVSCQVTFASASERVGIVFRGIDATNYLYLRVTSNATAYEIYKVVDGTPSAMFYRNWGSATPVGAAVTFQIALNGTSIIPSQNGVAGTSETSVQFQTGTRVGFTTILSTTNNVTFDTLLVKNGAAATIVSDTFTLFTGTEALAAHAPAVGSAWSVLANVFKDLRYSYLEWDAGTHGIAVNPCRVASADVEITANILVADKKAGVIARSNVDGTNRLILAGNTVYPYTDLTTAGGAVATGYVAGTSIPNGWHTIKWWMWKNSMRVWSDGVLYAAFQLATYQTNTYHGIGTKDTGGGQWKDILIEPAIGWKTVTVMGDSLSTGAEASAIQWWQNVLRSWNGARTRVCNHSVAGVGVVAGAQDLAWQVADAASDDADIILILLGTNDANDTGVQAGVESAIDALRISNPRSTIYYVNVLPRWTDNTTGPEVDRAATRAAIAAGCAARSVTCWDTYTTPWILQGDTSDGLHIADAGDVKVANEILARLPA